MKELTENEKKELWLLLNQFSMSDIVSEFESPKRVGHNYLSKCPFCGQDKSLMISDTHSIVKCTRCNHSHSKLDFIMLAKKIEITGVIPFLKSKL